MSQVGGNGQGGRGRPSSEAAEVATPVDGDLQLIDQLSVLARALEDEADLQATLDAIVHAAVGTVPGAQHASISVVLRRREVQTRASTGDVAAAVDRAQYETSEGPCLDTLYEQKTVRMDDMATETRWRAFCAEARQLGVGSMLAVQLFVRDTDLGALNLMSAAQDGFDDDSEHVALLFASHAAVAMAGAEAQDSLREGMQRRDLIGQAKGMLMERYGIDGEQAFALLARLSQDTNRKLHDLAHELIDTRQLPAPPAAAVPRQ